MDLIVCPTTGTEWSIYDIERIITTGFPRLSPRKRQAIQLFLIEDHSEESVARMMGVSVTNPIGMYATDGIVTILSMLDQGEL